MKVGKKITSLMLALVMIFSLTTGASAATTQNIKVQLSPNITVAYDNKVQTMADVNGNPVYPLLNGGTTYLPVRAVSNMLGVNVDWDGATQTVLLGNSVLSGMMMPDDTLPGISTSTRSVTIDNPTVERIRKVMTMHKFPDSGIEAAVAEFEAKGSKDADGKPIFTYTAKPVTTINFKTSKNAEPLGDKHAGCDYVEVNWSAAADGYVKVKLTKQVAPVVACKANSKESFVSGRNEAYLPLELDQWVNIPLFGESGDFQLTIIPTYSNAEQNSSKFDEIRHENFLVTFKANIKDPNASMLLSHVKMDFENAPKTVAKAAELTKNCETDAEKITAIFEFVAKTIKYDNKLYNDEQKQLVLGENPGVVGKDRNYSLDHILDTKTGVCEHYAILMAGMLRSQGIPCKVVSGKVNYPNIDFLKHAWVSVSPDTKDLNMSQLGAGHDEDGWIRLDPTWGGTPAGRADAAIDKNHESFYAY